MERHETHKEVRDRLKPFVPADHASDALEIQKSVDVWSTEVKNKESETIIPWVEASPSGKLALHSWQFDIFKKPIAPLGVKASVMKNIGIYGSVVSGLSLISVLGQLGRALQWGDYVGDMFGISLLAFGAFYLTLRIGKKGFKLQGARSRFNGYWEALKDNGYATTLELAKSAKYPISDVRNEINFMLREGFFYGGRFDPQTDTLVLNESGYLAKLNGDEVERKKERELPYFMSSESIDYEPAPTPEKIVEVEEVEEIVKLEEPEVEKQEIVESKPEDILEEGREYMRQMKAAVAQIESSEMKQDVMYLEGIAENIFQWVAENPGKLSKIRRFMQYYLPTTVKFVKAYGIMEKQSVQGSNIVATKEKIEESMKVIKQAFERLLDELFQKEAMEIHSDLIALETMMARDGLGGKDFIRMKQEEEEK